MKYSSLFNMQLLIQNCSSNSYSVTLFFFKAKKKKKSEFEIILLGSFYQILLDYIFELQIKLEINVQIYIKTI